MMAGITAAVGAILMAVGVVGYEMQFSDPSIAHPSRTALIPAILGGLLLVLGLLSFKDHLRKHTMHAAALLGLVGFFGTFLALPTLLHDLMNNEHPSLAVQFKSLTAAICLVFVGLCVNSFVQARLLRRRGEAATTVPMP